MVRTRAARAVDRARSSTVIARKSVAEQSQGERLEGLLLDQAARRAGGEAESFCR